jgi:hypothetical protein
MANKKITELPLINALSGSQIGGTVLPAVVGGTTNQISIENFSKFVNAYNAHTGSAGNVFSGPQTINNNVTINGRLTVNEVVTQYETASVLFSTGSTKLGDQLTDKHEFTGSTNITGSLTYNGVLLINIDANTISRLQQTTQSLQLATASLQFHSASVDNQLARVYQTTQSLHVATASLQQFTASQDSRNFTLSLYTASLEAQLARVYQTTQSLHVATASLNAFTASQDARNFIISQFTSSTDAHIVGISDFTSSQLAVNLGNAIYTASVDSHIVGISTYTSSVRDTLARVHQATQSLQVATASLQQFTASQDSRNFVVSQVTGSLIGITNGLMAFTAALDNTYATDAQLYQLYQATRSIELHSGSMIGVTNGLMAYTASNSTLNTGLRGEVDGIEAYTASLKGQAIVSSSTQVQNYDIFALNSNLYTSTGSLIGITNGLMAFTAALDSTYATDAQLYQLYAETASIKGEIAGIESYTASLKAAAIVSSSTQISNYYKFAETASASTTFYGNVIGQGNIQANKFVFTDAVINTNVGGQKIVATSGNILYLYSGTSGLYINNQANDTTIAQFTNGGQLTIGGPGNDQNLIFGGTNSSIYWGVGGPARMYYNVGDIKISSNGAADVLTVKNIGGISVSGGITGSLMATNGVISGSSQIEELSQIAGIEAYTASLKAAAIVSSSTQIQNYNLFAQTASANTKFYGNITASGNISVGTDSFTSPGGADRFIGVYSGQDSSIILQDSVETWEMYMNDDLYFTTGSTNPKNVISLRRLTGNVEVNEGNLVVSKGNIVMSTSGQGIDFSATSNGSGTTSSELLNDYEEGTWTPLVRGSATAGTYTLSGGSSAYYTKIGNQVTVYGTLGFSAASGGSGYMEIASLPFTYKANTGAVGQFFANNFDFAAGTLYAIIMTTSSGASTNLFVAEVQDNGVNTEAAISGVTTSTTMKFTFTYTVS